MRRPPQRLARCLLVALVVATCAATLASAQYCTPTYGTGCAFGDGLTLLQLNTINQSISCSGSPAWYHDYTATSTQLVAGTPYTITVQAGYSSTYVSIWVDLNNDYDLSDSGELLGQIICSASATNYSTTITIPTGTSTGSHRLRFATEWISYPGGPCSAQTYGNVGDFTIDVVTSSATGTTTTVTSSLNPSLYTQSVTFTATVAPVSGSGTPTGTVQFQVDGANFGSPVALASGVATLTTSTLTVGTHPIAALYGGDANFSTSSGSLSGGQVVNAMGTTTAVTSSVNPSLYTQSVTFTATVAPVSGSGTPTGTVQFQVDGANFGSPVALASGIATLTTSTLTVGTHPIAASYGGDANFSTSSGSLSGGQVVNAMGTTTAVTSSLNPSIHNQSVTFTATVAPVSGSGTPTGTVQFQVDGVDFAPPVTLASGVATLMTSVLSAGTHPIAASYGGDTGFSSSSGSLSGGQVVNANGTAANIAATAGTPQSTTAGTAFATALQATVTDSFGNPVPGVSVTFTPPASGASGTFASSPTVTTDASGVATAPTFTANSTGGGYQVLATASGVTYSAAFDLTNIEAIPALSGLGALLMLALLAAAGVALLRRT